MIQTICFLLGGVGLFLYGLDLASQGFRKIFAGRMRQFLILFTQNRVAGLSIGVFLTLVFQSSTATTVLLVGLVSSSILNLTQTLGVILGADIGTTLTIQLIAFKVDAYALLIFAIGVLIYFVSKYEKTKEGAKILMGFGLIFYGIVLMKTGMVPLRQSPAVMEWFVSLQAQPFWLLLAAMFLTLLIQSSAATIAIAIALIASSGTEGAPLLDLRSALPIILGANIGTCGTALLAGLRANRAGRQVALAHLLFKVAAVILVFPFLPLFASCVEGLSHWFAGENVSEVRMLANAHTLFNVAAAFVFLPFTQWVPRFLEKVYPKKGKRKGVAQTIQFDKSIFKTPDLALDQAHQEIQKMGKEVGQMLAQSIPIFEKEDSYLIEDLWRSDQIIDFRYKGLSIYLNKLSQTQLTEEEAKETRDCFLVMEELEHIGDMVVRHLVPLAQKKMEKGVDFSIEGFHDIMKLQGKVSKTLEEALKAFGTRNKEKGRLLLVRKSELSQKSYQMRLNHLERLRKGLRETLETSSIHLDVISAFVQIESHIMGIARIAAEVEDLGKQS